MILSTTTVGDELLHIHRPGLMIHIYEDADVPGTLMGAWVDGNTWHEVYIVEDAEHVAELCRALDVAAVLERLQRDIPTATTFASISAKEKN